MTTRWAIMVVVVVVVGIATALFARHYRQDKGIIRIGDRSFRVLIADDEAERVHGLSGVPSLADDTVMLFVFPASGRHGIWMKEMRFALDILWLNEEGDIVHIREHISPDTYPEVFTPDSDARYVIEMNAGSVVRFDIKIGQRIFDGSPI